MNELEKITKNKKNRNDIIDIIKFFDKIILREICNTLAKWK